MLNSPKCKISLLPGKNDESFFDDNAKTIPYICVGF
jgi:hypothetical protein